MTLWAVRIPATASLLTVLILILPLAHSTELSACLNVGTVVFGPIDALACCLDAERYAALVFRKMLNNVVVVPLQQPKGDAYISAFVSFVHSSARAAVNAAPTPISRAFVTALLDTSGGYLRSYLLPVTREAFYAGNVRFAEVRKLFDLYDEIKDYLHTKGQGWAVPRGKYGIRHNVRSLDITSANQDEFYACDNFFFYATAWAAGNVGRKSDVCVIPIPFFDDNKNPRSVALPLRYGSLHSIETPESAYILLGHYVRSIRCLQARAVSTATFVDYNKKFRHWLILYVLPRLGDERWYPAFGGILRVLKKTGEYIHTSTPSKDDASALLSKVRRPRRDNEKATEGPEDTEATQETDSIAEAVADDLVPIDVAVLQKIMHPDSEQEDVMKPDNLHIPLLPALRYFESKTKTNFDEPHSFEISAVGVSVRTSALPHSEVTDSSIISEILKQSDTTTDKQVSLVSSLRSELNNSDHEGVKLNNNVERKGQEHMNGNILKSGELESTTMVVTFPEKRILGSPAETSNQPLVITELPVTEQDLFEESKRVSQLTSTAKIEKLTSKNKNKYRGKEEELWRKTNSEKPEKRLELENEIHGSFRKGKPRFNSKVHIMQSSNPNILCSNKKLAVQTNEAPEQTDEEMVTQDTQTKESILCTDKGSSETTVSLRSVTQRKEKEVNIKWQHSETHTKEKINNMNNIETQYECSTNHLKIRFTLRPAVIPKIELSNDLSSQPEETASITRSTVASTTTSTFPVNHDSPETSPQQRTKLLESQSPTEPHLASSEENLSEIPQAKTTPGKTRICITPETHTKRHRYHSMSQYRHRPRITTKTTARTPTTTSMSLGGSGSYKSVSGGTSDHAHTFQNVTDGCVVRVWDGRHAPSPLVAHMLADVLQSPVLNLDFAVCHLLVTIIAWLLLLCTSMGMPDCRCRWWKDYDFSDEYWHGDNRSKRSESYDEEDEEDEEDRLVFPTYYNFQTSSGGHSMYGRYNQTMCALTAPKSNRHARSQWERASPEEKTPLNAPNTTSSSKPVAHPVHSQVSGSSVEASSVRHQPVRYQSHGKTPVHCLYPVSKKFLGSVSDDTDVTDPEARDMRSTRFSH